MDVFVLYYESTFLIRTSIDVNGDTYHQRNPQFIKCPVQSILTSDNII